MGGMVAATPGFGPCANPSHCGLGRAGGRQAKSGLLEVPRRPDTVWSADFVDDFNRGTLPIYRSRYIDTPPSVCVCVCSAFSNSCNMVTAYRRSTAGISRAKHLPSRPRPTACAIRYIQPGKLNQNATIEHVNLAFRKEVLDEHLFLRLDDVREAAYSWTIEYSGQRPHDALGNLTPAKYRQHAAGDPASETLA
ncbi:integrase core domain-containing protein [Immundisolibacter sp.]|uniref:integrase core domain-containing protein n=1 Tax=Immundisolibacter sp. TaxID=1934948 RepID=UPI003F4F5CE6